MIIGARASLQIIYVDKKLADAVTEDLKTDEWAKQMVQYLGSDAPRGIGPSIAHTLTFKPWDVDPKNVFIGGYSLRHGDVLSPSMTNPFGPLDSGVKGFFAFVVPLSELKKGKEIKIGYGDDYALWKAPK